MSNFVEPRLCLVRHPYLVRVGGVNGGRFSNLLCALSAAHDEQYRMACDHDRHVEWEVVDGSRRWASDERLAG